MLVGEVEPLLVHAGHYKDVQVKKNDGPKMVSTKSIDKQITIRADTCTGALARETISWFNYKTTGKTTVKNYIRTEKFLPDSG